MEKKKNIAVVILSVVVVILSVLIVLFATNVISFRDSGDNEVVEKENYDNQGVNDNNNNNNNDDENNQDNSDSNDNDEINNNKIIINNKSVDDGILNTVLNIIGIPYFNNSSNACLTDAISVNNYSTNAKKIMSLYIDSCNYRYLKNPEDNIYGSEECGYGAADCYTISKENAKELFNMFNFDGKITDYFQESTNLKDDYIFWYGHTLGFCDMKINHDIVAEYSSEEKKNEYGINIGADITIIDKQNVFKNIIDVGNGSKVEKIERTVTYIFKPATNGNYYLSNVDVK